MAKITWTKFFWSKYWAKTRHFTCAAQHGIYFNLIGSNMVNGPLPMADGELRRVSCANAEEWQAHGASILKQFFRTYRNRYVNQTAMEIRHAAIVSLNRGDTKKKSEAGKKGAAARWARELEEDPPPPDDLFADAQDVMDAADDGPLSPQEMNGYANGHAALEEDIGGWDVPEIADQVTEAVELYNAMAGAAGLPVAQFLNATRTKKLKMRLKECGGIPGWKSALERIRSTPGLCGRNDRHWRANIDFLLQASSFTKLMEGYYDGWKGTGKNGHSDDDDKAAILAGLGSGKLAHGDGSAGNHKKASASSRSRHH